MRLDQYIGNVFYRTGDPVAINNMSYTELKYWSGWHDIISKAENPEKK